jgi:hypothetical protein
VHLRLRDLPLAGALAAGEARLLERERAIDLALLGGGPALRARLLSVGLERAIELELLGAKAARDVRFEVQGAGVSDADPADYAGQRAVIDLPGGLQPAEQQRRVAAWLVTDDGGPQQLGATVTLPRLEAHLAVAIDPARLRARARRVDGTWQLEVTLPQAYRALVTGALFRVHRAGAVEELSAEDRGTRFVARVVDGEPPLVEAVVVASGRQRIAVPVRCAAR